MDLNRLDPFKRRSRTDGVAIKYNDCSEKGKWENVTIESQNLTSSSIRNGYNQWWTTGGLRLHNILANKRKTTWVERSLENLTNINNGKAIRTMMSTKHPTGWLWSDKRLRVGNKVRCIQALSSTLPTMINKTKACRALEEKRCWRCHKETEDVQHILSACEMNAKLIQERHNRLVNKIG